MYSLVHLQCVTHAAETCPSHILRLGRMSGKPGTTPISVTIPTDPRQPEAGSRTIKIWPVLVAVEGDIPFMEKVTNSIGHSAKHACFRCALSGEWHPEAKTVRSAPLIVSLLCAHWQRAHPPNVQICQPHLLQVGWVPSPYRSEHPLLPHRIKSSLSTRWFFLPSSGPTCATALAAHASRLLARRQWRYGSPNRLDA